MANDLDYLAARLHGRRACVAEGGRLDALCSLRSLPELARAIFPEKEFHRAFHFQRRLVQELIRELSGFCSVLNGGGADLMDWMLVRFQVENLKVLVRGWTTKVPIEELRHYLVSLPKQLVLDAEALAAAGSPGAFAMFLPKGPIRKSLEKAVEMYGDRQRPFFLETALDRGYFQELLARVERLSGADKEIIKEMVCQEVDIFHLMLVVRGKFHYNLTPGVLLPFHVAGTVIQRERFSDMLGDSDLPTATGRAAERLFDASPSVVHAPGEASLMVGPALLERLAWKRFLRLANRAFRRSHVGLGVIVGYTGIRRVEVGNLITLSEGIRKGMDAGIIRDRLIRCSESEAPYV